MQIKSLEVSNFRNIEHLSTNLGYRTTIKGRNFTGKTNTLLAIHWLLSDFLLDGSQDLSSLKPSANPEAKVMTKIVLDDDTSIEKCYYENWVKTKGSDITTLVGHSTVFYINGTRQPTILQANELIKEKFGINKLSFKTAKIDLLRMLINPFYLTGQVDWKTLRSFIIELVKDVSDDDVVACNNRFLVIKDLLDRNFHKTDLAAKYCLQQIKTIKEDISKINTLIEQLETVEDVGTSLLDVSLSKKEKVDDEIGRLVHDTNARVNPKIRELELSIQELSSERNESAENDRHLHDDLNQDIYSKLNLASNDKNRLINETALINDKKNLLTKSINELKARIQSSLERITQGKSHLYDMHVKLDGLVKKDTEDFSLPLTIKCPCCGTMIKDQAWEKARTYLNDSLARLKEKNSKEIEELEKEIKRTMVETDSLESSVQYFHDDLIKAEQEVSKYNTIEDKTQQLQKISESIQALNALVKPYEPSIKTKELNHKIDILKNQLESEKLVDYTSDTKALIHKLKDDREECESIIRKHYIYLDTQRTIVDKRQKVEKQQKELNDFENKQLLIGDFIKAKLGLLDANVRFVFGNIKFCLVENNIKEGSYSEVCYPYILNKETPFANGSTSEKIITGIAIIEAIRKHLSLPTIPILFDGAESLDNTTLNNILNTTCQIITTKVDDDDKDLNIMLM